MKRHVKAMILLLPFVMFSCFYFTESSSSRQTLKILLISPSDVVRMHVGVYEGIVTYETELYRETVEGNILPSLQAPPGLNRIFLLYAEGSSGRANYYGVTPPLTIQKGDTLSITVKMQKFSDAPTFNFVNLGATQTWNAIPGALVYDVLSSGIHFDYTSNNFYSYASLPSPSVRIYSSIFGIGSDANP